MYLQKKYKSILSVNLAFIVHALLSLNIAGLVCQYPKYLFIFYLGKNVLRYVLEIPKKKAPLLPHGVVDINHLAKTHVGVDYAALVR